MSEEIQVGTVLYREMTGRNAGTKIKEEVVKRIGAKYIYLDGYSERYPVDRKTLQHVSKEYCQNNFQLYLTKEEILDRREKSRLFDLFESHFSWRNGGKGRANTIEQLRAAAEILGIEIDKQTK